MNNLADNPVHATKVRELHGHLSSLVNPDAITEAAFKKQHQVLMTMVRKKTPEEFSRMLMGRLGRGQATAFTRKYYQNWQPAPAGHATT